MFIVSVVADFSYWLDQNNVVNQQKWLAAQFAYLEDLSRRL